ncbi:MAG: tryptophan synthase subunit alpha [Actinomycetota bacterium]
MSSGQAQIRATLGEGKALLPYLTAGLPHPDRSVELYVAMAAAGADAFEVGIPYSDPLMDGPVIMRGSHAALRAGTTPDVALRILSRVVESTGKPALAMTYANPVMQIGWDRFAGQLANAGAVGLIVPDLPWEESGPLADACRRAGVGLVQFVSPMTGSERIRRVAESDPAFLYGVSDMGVTGERHHVSPHVAGLSERVRTVTKVPLVLGVGITTPEQARAVRHLADGVIVGTALVRRVLEAETPEIAVRSVGEAVADFKAALN